MASCTRRRVPVHSFGMFGIVDHASGCCVSGMEAGRQMPVVPCGGPQQKLNACGIRSHGTSTVGRHRTRSSEPTGSLVSAAAVSDAHS